MIRFCARGRAHGLFAAASVVVIAAGLVSAPDHADRSVFRPELHAGVALQSAVTALNVSVTAPVPSPSVHSNSAATTAKATASDCSIDFFWTCGGLTPLVVFFFLIFVAPVAIALQNVGLAIQNWVQQVTDFFSPAAPAVPATAAARRLTRPASAAAGKVALPQQTSGPQLTSARAHKPLASRARQKESRRHVGAAATTRTPRSA